MPCLGILIISQSTIRAKKDRPTNEGIVGDKSSIFVDCEQTLPHIANITIKPRVHEGRWYVGYDSKTGPVLWDALVPPPLIRRVAHANETVKVVGDL